MAARAVLSVLILLETFLNNPLIREEITRKMESFKLNENEIQIYQNLWDTAKSMQIFKCACYKRKVENKLCNLL